MIWMNDGAGYHMSNTTTKWQQQMGLIRIHWPAQSPNLNRIENLWRIIKIRVSAHCYQIHSVNKMKTVIEEE